MLLMKAPAIKNFRLGPAILVGGIVAGGALVVGGRVADKTPLIKDTLLPNGFLIAWFCLILGIWVSIMSINAKQLKLPFPQAVHVGGTIVLVLGLYFLGVFVHPITIACAFLAMLIILVSISVFIWALPKRERDATWAEAVFGGVCVFAMMTFIYAIIPHEWITFATSYLGFTKDAKVSKGGEFFLKTWIGGDLWTKNTRVLPFEVNYETLQDQMTMAIYVAAATLNIKMFAAWQKRNVVVAPKEETEETEAPKKTSRFGRPIRNVKANA